MLWVVVEGPLYVGHLPYMLDTSPVWGCLPICLNPYSLVGFPVHLYVLAISACVMGNIPLMLGIWGCSPICWGFGRHQQHWVSICFILYLLVVHYVSHIYHGYDHYSSGYSGVFWAVIYFISDCGSFLMGLLATLGQGEVVLPPPLMLRGSGGVIGLASVPRQQTPSLMPLLVYANYAMGSSQIGFFFRFEPPTILYIICLVSILVSALYFQVPSWMPYSPRGAQPLGFAPLQPFGVYPWQAYVQHGDGDQSMPGLYRVAAPSATLSRGTFLVLSLLFPAIPSIWWGIQPWGLGRESPDPSAFPT